MRCGSSPHRESDHIWLEKVEKIFGRAEPVIFTPPIHTFFTPHPQCVVDPRRTGVQSHLVGKGGKHMLHIIRG
jgi:hypothetical protein